MIENLNPAIHLINPFKFLDLCIRRRTEADGNCYFWALWDHLKLQGSSFFDHHLKLRQFIVNFMEFDMDREIPYEDFFNIKVRDWNDS